MEVVQRCTHHVLRDRARADTLRRAQGSRGESDKGQSVHYHPVLALVAPPAERRACCSPPPIWWHRSHLWRFGERRIAEFVWQSRLSSPLFSARCRVLLPSPAAMFLRHTQLFLWKNSLQKARNPGQTSCELLTPVLLVALFALLCVGAPRRVPCCVCRCARRGGGRCGHPLPRRRLPFAGSSTPT
jgi:hypothetical protein